jgi:hypothetical protein
MTQVVFLTDINSETMLPHMLWEIDGQKCRGSVGTMIKLIYRKEKQSGR